MVKGKSGLLLLAGCISLVWAVTPLRAQNIGTGAFPNTNVIEQQLKRGISTKVDAQRLLGVPNGTGGSNWLRPPGTSVPPLGEGPREIWFYDDVEVADMKSGDGAIAMKLRQQILLVFFKGDIFDGYVWTSNVLAGSANR